MMSSHGDQILFEILEELREIKAFIMRPTSIGGPSSEEEEVERIAEKIVDEAFEGRCDDCGCGLNEGEAKTFTVCDACWDKHYKGED